LQSAPAHGMSLVWGSLRNLFDFPNVVILDELRLMGTVPGHFPVDAHNAVPLQIPRGGQKGDLSGRYNSLTPELWNTVIDQGPSWTRVVHLPLYGYDSNISNEILRKRFSAILKKWNDTMIPGNIPCAALATRVRGGYCIEREAELVFVLLVWANQVARTLQLDWHEGPLEDCISPEWYIKTSRTLPLQEALRQNLDFVGTLPNWTNLQMSLVPKPAFLGESLIYGTKKKGAARGWQCEWNYFGKMEFSQDTERILEDVETLFKGVASENSVD